MSSSKLSITLNLDTSMDQQSLDEELDSVLLAYGLNLSRVVEKTVRNWLRKARLPVDVFCEEVSVIEGDE